MKPEEFINIINKTTTLSENFGMPIDQLPNYITQQELELEKVRGETEETELKQLQVLQYSNRTTNDLEESEEIDY